MVNAILRIIASLGFIIQKGIEIWQNYRARQDGKNELLLEQEAMKEKSKETVEDIHRRLEADPTYHDEIIQKIKERAQ